MTMYSDGLEQEHPQECKEIREDEFKKAIYEFRALLYEYEHGRKPHTCATCRYERNKSYEVYPCNCCKNMYECKWEEKNETVDIPN